MRIMVYGDSNSWGTPPDGSGIRFDARTRWPSVMARQLGATLIEAALPGRTTVHDDPEIAGAVMNGLTHLPVALLSHSPLDLVLIMLGTNDFKARFSPDAGYIAANIGRLLDCIAAVGGGRGAWDSGNPPAVAIVVPPVLPSLVASPEFEHHTEWRGGPVASAALAEAVELMAKSRNVLVFNANSVVAGSVEDPIHLYAASHVLLGQAVASWLQKLNEDAEI
ncbi:MAG: GDSL-type esterase/lipase family protein [Paracoccaceae bacterium]